jgi:tetratricopeptide (TPR) repeat protein
MSHARSSLGLRVARGIALSAGLAAAAMTAAVPVAQAQSAGTSGKEKEAARMLAQMGYELFVAGKYEEAIVKLDQAEAIFHAPPHLELSGRALEKLGRLLRARERYQRVAAEPPAEHAPKAFRETYAAAVKALDTLKTRIPSLQLKLTGPSADKALVSIDGKAVSAAELLAAKELDPGTYTLRIEAAGRMTETRTVAFAEGSHQTLELALKAKEPAAAGPRGPLAPAIVAFGAGAAGIALGAVAGAVSLGAVGDLERSCPDKHCPLGQAGTLEKAKTLSTVSTASFVVGGLLGAAGGVLLVVRPGGAKVAAGLWLAPAIGPTQVGMKGVF